MAAGCTGGAASGTLYVNAEVEPFVAADPRDDAHRVGIWQQDRWSNGAARAVVSAVSFDGGRSWARQLLPMSRCGGAAAGSAGDLERVTDPWVDIGGDGVVHVMALAISGAALQSGARSAMLASRSTDGGRTFSAPVALIDDGASAFNDKNTLTVDPIDPRFVYAVWDRLDASGRGPAMLARSTDGGLTWESARAIADPQPAGGAGVSQTIGNRIVVVAGGPDRGTLVNVFVQIDTVNGASTASVRAQRSSDRGATFGAPVLVAEHRAVGTSDPVTGRRVRDGAILPALAAGPDGSVWVAWQDGRFSGGARDAITLVRSVDGGRSWSAPVAVNSRLGVAAFTPTLHVRADGTLGLMHYDLRPDTADRATLFAAAWLLTTRDGVSFSETAVGGSFDLAGAPDAGGLFLGDYQGLTSRGTRFAPLLAFATADATNRTDIYALDVEPALPAGASAASHRARPLAASTSALDDAALRRRHHEAIVQAMERRVTGWAARVRARPAGDDEFILR